MAKDTDGMRAYHVLRDLIVQAKLKPGSQLEEEDLIDRLKVGRTPFRDALHRLTQEGLVEIIPRKGSFVTQVTVRDLQQIFRVRLKIEEIVAQLAVDNCTSHHLDVLTELIESQAESDPDGESDVTLDTKFHDLMLEIADNKYLDNIYRMLRLTALRLLYLTDCGMESNKRQQQFFLSVREALSSQDVDGVTDLLQDHVMHFEERLANVIFVSQNAEIQQESQKDDDGSKSPSPVGLNER